MNRTDLHTISTPLDQYLSVCRGKSHQQKDELVIKLAIDGLSAADEEKTASEACQKQFETLAEWCAAPILSQPQRELIDKLISLDSVTCVCVLSLEPVFDLYVIGNGDNTDIYDEISTAIVNYKYSNKTSAAYMYMTESEFENCTPDGIIQKYWK